MSDEINKNEDENQEQSKKENFSASDMSEEEKRRIIEGDNFDEGLGNAFQKSFDQNKKIVDDNQKANEAEEVETDPYLKSAQSIKEHTGRAGLGNVKHVHGEETGDINADMVLGWTPIYLDDMPSEGRFYPEDMKIHIRAAQTKEIRHWSTLNERDLFDVDDKLNHITQNCTRVQSGKRMMSWKDILEEDRIYLILAIRDLTFKEGENKLQVQKQCPHCGTQNTIEINNGTLDRMPIEESIEKYYDPVEKVYNIQTRSFGTIKMKPPSIGVMSIVTKFINQKQQEGGYWDQSYIQIFPYLHHNWRGLKEKDIFDGEVDFQGWPEKKYMLVYRIAEKMKVGVQPEIITECQGCKEEITAPVDFRNGIKAIFIPTISDITDELL